MTDNGKAEHALIQVSCDLLGVDTAQSSDTFVQLGGDSLLAIKAVARLHRQHGLILPASALLRPLTFAELAGQCQT